jgi:phosphoribosylanthranilate isomerase
MKTFVKLTGLTSPESVAEVPAGGAAGFIMHGPQTPTGLTVGAVALLLEALPKEAEGWAIVADPTIEQIQQLFDEAGVDRIQVYGAIPEGLEFLQIHSLVPSLPIPRAGVPGPDPTVPPAEDYARLHLDAQGATPASGSPDLPDWEVCHRLVEENPGRKLVLAGGLTVENVGEALGQVRPWGVDVGAALRGPSGDVDLERARAFVAAVLAFESATTA